MGVKITYDTTILGFGKHAAIEIPPENLAELGGNKRAPLKITLNGYTYQNTATGMDGKCLVVFPTKDREASGVGSGDHVDMPPELVTALQACGLSQVFHDLTYSKRKEFVRQVAEAKALDTKARRVEKIIEGLQSS